MADETTSLALNTDKRMPALRATLDKLRPQFANALPKHVTAERFVRIILTSVQRTPKLLDCTPESFLGAVLQCAALGLEPDGLLGQAHLVPFGQICQFIPGYRGLIKLVRQSGEVAGVYGRVVRERDTFEYEFGLNERLEHVPHRGNEPGQLIAAYAVCRFKGGELPQFDVMERWEIDRIRDSSKGYQNALKYKSEDSPWIAHYDAMAMKTVLRRLCKLLPQSVEKDNLARAIALDEAADANLPQSFDVTLPAQPQLTHKPEADENPPAVQPEPGARLPLGAEGAKKAAKKEDLAAQAARAAAGSKAKEEPGTPPPAAKEPEQPGLKLDPPAEREPGADG